MNLTALILMHCNSLFNTNSGLCAPSLSEVGKQRAVGTAWTTTQRLAPWCRKGERGRGRDGNTLTTTVRKMLAALCFCFSYCTACISFMSNYVSFSHLANVVYLVGENRVFSIHGVVCLATMSCSKWQKLKPERMIQ